MVIKNDHNMPRICKRWFLAGREKKTVWENLGTDFLFGAAPTTVRGA
jgi:hypothetical protein